MASDVLHGDDTPVPVLAPGAGKTKTGRLWVYVRDERPHAGDRPPAAVFFYSPDRKGEHPVAHLKDFVGVLHADGYAGFNGLYEADRKPGPIVEAACWAHLWMPPHLQGSCRRFGEYPQLRSSIRPVMATRPAPPALMVNPQAESQSCCASSRLDAPNGFTWLRYARFRHHTLKDPRICVGLWIGRCQKNLLRNLSLRGAIYAAVPQQ